MQCGVAGFNLIKSFEGFSPVAYQDQGGRWTIGYGQTGEGITEGMTCTMEQACDWLQSSVNTVSAALTRMIKVPVNQNQFDSLVSLAYNIGIGNFSSSSALATLNDGDYDAVPAHVQMWDEVDGIADVGLIRRRAAEVALYQKPVEA